MFVNRHRVFPVIVVRFLDEEKEKEKDGGGKVEGKIGLDKDGEEEEHVFHKATDKH